MTTTKKTISKPRRRSKRPVFREMAFTQMADPKAAASCMEHLASSTEIGTTVLEMRARGHKDGAAATRWFLAAAAAHLQDLEGLLRTHLPVHIYQPRHARRAPDMAATIRLRGSHPHLNPAHIEDAARAVFGVIASLENQDELTVQLLLGRRHSPPMYHRNAWSELFQVLLAGGKAPARNPEPSQVLRARAQQHGFDSAIRIAAKASTPERARHLISKLRSALKVLEASGTRLQLAHIPVKRVDQTTRPWKWPLRLASSEAAAVAAWPLGAGDLPAFGSGHPRMFPPPPKIPTSSRVIGTSAASGFETEKVALPIQSAPYMTHLCGPTGVGKSTAMLNLITHDMGLGSSVVLIDMKGDLATDVLTRVPMHRRKDVVVLDAAADTVVGLNPLNAPHGMEAQTADQLLAVFEGMDDRPWGVGVRQTFTTAVHTLTRVPGSTLLDVIPLLTDPGFRRQVLAQINDDTGLEFWQHFDTMTPEQQSITTMPVVRRLHPIQMRPSLRGILGQAQPKFDLRDLLTRRKILVVNLNKGMVGAEPARILGNLLVGMLWQQTLTRQRIPAERRHIISLYIDEAQEFVKGLAGGNDLADMLAQARSLGLAVHLANQYLGQFSPKIQEAVLTNTRNKIYLPLSQADARIASKDTSLDPADLTLLPAYHAQVRMVLQGQDSEWMTVKLNKAPRATADSAQVYAASQTRYGIPVADVENARKQKQSPRPRPQQSEQRPGSPSGFGRRVAQ